MQFWSSALPVADGEAAVSLCLALSLSHFGYNRNCRWDGGGGVCVLSHRGMGSFPVSACVWCLQPAFDKPGRDVITPCAKWKSSGDINASKRQLAQVYCNVRAPKPGLQDLDVIDYLTIKTFGHLKWCNRTEFEQCFKQLTAAHRSEYLETNSDSSAISVFLRIF